MAEIYRPDPAGKTPGGQNKGPKKNNKKKMTPAGRALTIVSIVLAVALAIFGLYHLGVWYYTSMMKPQDTDEVYVTHTIEETETETETVTEELPIVVLPTEHNGEVNAAGLPLICDTRAVKNILLIGIDARAKGKEAGLSDSMMILSINTERKSITLTSLERDTLVQIPGHGQEKLTHAHAYGGADLLIQTLKDNYNIEINYWARVNFYSFVDIVDALGGLDVTMAADEVHYMNFYLLEINELYGRPRGTDELPEVAGTYHLNGHQTLGYCRNRYSDSDFGRMARQRNVIDLMVQKTKTLNPLQLDHLLKTVLPMVTTNMPQEVRHSLAAAAPAYLFYSFNKGCVPEQGEYHFGRTPGGLSVVVVNDMKASCEKLYEAIYGPPEPEKTTETATAAATGAS